MEFSFGEPQVAEAAVRFATNDGWAEFTMYIDSLPESKSWKADGIAMIVNNVESNWWFHSGITFGDGIRELLLVQQDIDEKDNLRNYYTRFLRLTRTIMDPVTYWGSGNVVTFHDSVENLSGEDGVVNQDICQSDYFFQVYHLSRR